MTAMKLDVVLAVAWGMAITGSLLVRPPAAGEGAGAGSGVHQ